MSDAQADIGTGLVAADAMARFHVRLPDGRLVSGARAFAAIWERLPAWKWAARLASLPGITMALEAAYRLFLPVRPFISRQINPKTAGAFLTRGDAGFVKKKCGNKAIERGFD